LVSAKRNIQWFKDSRNNYCHKRPKIYEDTDSQLRRQINITTACSEKKCGFTFPWSKFHWCN